MSTHTRGLAALVLVVACGCTNSSGGSETGHPTPTDCSALGSSVASEGWVHLKPGEQPTYTHNPPASGPHDPYWADYKVFETAVPRRYWVHNLEHGAIVLLHRPDAAADVIAGLKSAYDAIADDPACGHKRVLLTPDPDLDSAVAIVAANVVDEADRLDTDRVVRFVSACRNHAPEDVCGRGTYE